MNKSLFFLAFLLTCSILSAQVSALTPLEAKTMDARVLITNTVTLEITGSRYNVNEVSGKLTWFPRQNWLQEVKSSQTDPQASQTDDALSFVWPQPRQTESIAVSSVVKTRNSIVPVREQIPFPLQELPSDVAPYLEAGEITDQTPEIQALAQQLAAGKTDAYEIVYTLADWTTTNVHYSLASVGQPAIQRSSQVLQSKEGKCDELTALFISMNRALGIPARFVAGYAYTNSPLFNKPWGGHGWAEVWLPGQGWVPFDVTYGEYGYLDAGHVTLKYAPDAKESSIDYSARGIDFGLRTEPLDITITPLNLEPQNNDDIKILLDAPHKTIGFGSAALILATVTNQRDYYVSTRLDLGKTSNTDILSSTYANILLKPYETKTVPILIKLDDNLKSGYVYEFPFKLSSRLGPSADITLRAEENAPVYDKSAFVQYFTPPQTTKSDISITCDRGKSAAVGAPVLHNCIAEGRLPVRVCETACITVTQRHFTIETVDRKAGIFTRTYTARDSKFFVTSKTVLPTNLTASLSGPSEVTPDDIVLLSFNASATGALAEDINITLRAKHATAAHHLDDMNRPVAILFSLPARALRPGQNTLSATVTFQDELGNAHTESFTTTIELTNVGISDRIQFWLEDISEGIIGLFGG